MIKKMRTGLFFNGRKSLNLYYSQREWQRNQPLGNGYFNEYKKNR